MTSNADNLQENMVYELKITPGELTLGRGEDNTFCFADASVSTHHARITTLFNASYIEDLGSTNGTYINGKKAQKHTLHDGDTVLLGEQLIRIVKSDLMSVV
jgi:pSer/pThr/pTyr-binding forkhead associated (FHA) protein